jgi:Xaa-Pro aminopeptidase
MKYLPISSHLFVKNRKKFISEMKSNSVAFFNSNDIYPVSADSTLPFEQHRDIFYLTGVDQEESVLFLCPNAKKKEYREILFLRETNEHIAIWEGAKLSKLEATKTSGVTTVLWLDELNTVLSELMEEVENVYININSHYRSKVETETREDRFIKKVKKDFSEKNYEASNPILQRIRSIKEKEELELIQKACDITEKGLRRLLSFVKPGVWEYEIEAELIHEFVKNRSKGFAYTPIVASGNNANVLHYIENNQQCKSGELILMDVAAEYANYSSDLTRTLPVSGVFSKRQKEVYNAVNKIKKEATKLLVPGTILKEYQEEVGRMMTSELIHLKLIDKLDVKNQDPEWPAYKKYFMHGISHHMGLDTHDYGVLTDPIEANMVFTVEPGIYIPEEGFGIRLEDDVVIQESGEPFNLMANIPIEHEEIEDLMN